MNYIEEFKMYIMQKGEKLRELDASKVSDIPFPGKWSKKEILGHLIDSASNNHKRFVEAVFKNDLIFEGYEQDNWVSVQNYQESPWNDLIELWKLLNLHIAHVMENIPSEIKTRQIKRHNLNYVAFQKIEEDEPVTLELFIHDYIAHLKHHIDQILTGS